MNLSQPPQKWLLLLLFLVTPLLTPVQSFGCGEPNNPCPPTFTDGIYYKFGLNLGDAGRTHRFAIFTYGGGTSSSPFSALEVSATTSTTLFGYQIMGDIGMAGAYSRLTVSGYGSVSGDRYSRTTSTEVRVGPNAVIGGTRYSSSSIDSLALAAITALKNVSTTAAGFASTAGSPTNIALTGGSMSFSNNPFNGKYVMNLSNLTLTNGAVLTLNGAAGTAFVINVSGSFSLTNSSQIVLSGGLTTSDVLFNIKGNSGTFQITGSSLFQGTLLAYNSATNGTQRTLTIDGSNTLLRGEVIANRVVVTNGARVRIPPRASCDDDRDEGRRGQERD